MASTDALHWGDILVIVAYFVAVLVVGLWSSCRNRGSVGGYFLAGRSMHWIPVGASLFASNIGSGHFVGLAGSGAASGIGIGIFELSAIFILIILGWIFVPVYIAAGVFTMPEYMRKRFGGQRIRVYLTVLALLLSIFTKISADLFAGYIFINQSLKIDLYLSIVILLLIAAVFTIAGGLTAVIWTDFIQTIIMIVGAFILMGMSFVKVGGYQNMVDRFMTAIPNTTRVALANSTYATCGIPPKTSMHLVRPYDDADLPWPGVFFGLTISSIWYWCSDQVIVQRALSAKNYSHAKAGALLAGYLKFLPMFIIVFPGMIARVLYPDEVACADPDTCERVCNQRNGCTNIAYPLLVLRIMPSGLRGLMLAVMMSALMSSLTSIFNSSSTLFTMDIWRLIRKNSSDMELMIVGRCSVLFLVAVSVAWIPLVQGVPELFHYIQAITAFLAPPICGVYVLAIFSKRINEQGAFWGLMGGLVVGLTRFIWEYSYGSAPPCGEARSTPVPDIVGKVHYLHFAIILCAITVAITITVSLLTKPMDEKYLVRLTFFDRHNDAERADISELDDKKEKKEPAYDNDAFAMTAASQEGVNTAAAVSTTEIDMEGKKGRAMSTGEEEALPWYRTCFNWICGIEKMQEAPELTEHELAELEKEQTSIEEVPFWRRIINVNAVILMALAIFMWAFFG